jgi:signal transduction histidine kinase
MPVPVQSDSGRFSQVLNNLLSNATKYSHDGTEIVLSR